MGLQSFIATGQQVYELGDPAMRSAALLSPPEPPFLFVLGTMSKPQFQHLIWRTPFSLSKDLFTVRLGGSLMQIRPRLVHEAVAASQQLLEAYRAIDKRFKGSVPFVYERTAIDPAFGQLRPGFMVLKDASPELASAITFLQSQSRATLWAAGQVLVSPPSTEALPLLNTEKLQ
jgi:CRISPR type IV-associated protein Csf1